MWYTYIIQSQKDNKYYIGSTGNLEKRIEQHNSGASLATRHRRPFNLEYFQAFETKSQALRREYQIKQYKGGQAFKKLIGNVPK